MRIVVADNDPDALELVVTDLRLEGHEVVAAVAGGEQAVALCACLHPDVLVVDYRMPPGIDGAEVARRMADGVPATRVIVYSNYDQPAVVRAVERCGARFVAKGSLRALRRALS